MSTTNLGNQYITFDYRHPATGEDFNTLLKGAIKAGIYEGGLISITGGNTVSVAPFIVYMNVGTDKIVRIQTRAAVAITVTEATPVLVITYTWQNVSENWIDWHQRAHASAPITNEICLGECIFAGGVITSIDYTDKTWGMIVSGAELSLDGTFSNNSDQLVPSEKAIVTYTSDGWLPSREDWAYASADSPTFLATVSGDKRSKYSKGMKLKLEQEQALTGLWTFDSDATSQVGSFTPTNIGTPTYTAGKFGNALTLDGSTDAISLADNALLKPTGDFTIGCWFKTSATGAVRTIFSSQSANTAVAGIFFFINSSNKLFLRLGKNTGTSLGADYLNFLGVTTVTDGNWHYTTLTIRNNWCQIYLDGKLEVSGYTFAPVYAGTNYVRIGCNSDTGSNGSFFNGQIDDLFLINGYALDEETIRAKYESDTAQGTGNITVTKKFILTDISYSAPNTTLTMYGGTDFALSNGAISNPFYSMVEQPFGFNRNPDKWSVAFNTSRVYSNPTYSGSVTWNPSIQINIPIGNWTVESVIIAGGTSTGAAALFSLGLSTETTTLNIKINTYTAFAPVGNGYENSLYFNVNATLKQKTTYYVLFYCNVALSAFINQFSSGTYIKATSVYL